MPFFEALKREFSPTQSCKPSRLANLTRALLRSVNVYKGMLPRTLLLKAIRQFTKPVGTTE